uniref:Helicase C-terminal domain-containing protein n=1 Tax=Mesocestoides corti TaxID=53468 RepID=A0A0R3U7I7_MESCO
LIDRDRRAVEELFVNQKIQVLIATSTLAWGVNFPAHLVIVKGTEYFDGHTKRYIDYPITDVLQMMGRAGRPQFDMEGKAVVMVQDTKKAFYKRFLYEPFPVESCLPKILPDYLNAEIAAGSVTSMQGALECLTWTFYYRRLLVGLSSYYQLEEASPTSVNAFLSKVVSDAVTCLLDSGCVEADSEDPSLTLYSTSNGRLASFYYLSHRTISLFIDQIMPTSSIEDLLYILSMCEEFALMPVRHGEDEVNATLASQMPLRVRGAADSPHTKAHILLQSHLSRRTHQLPIADYATDTKSLLDQTPRIIQAMIDFSAEQGWLACTLRSILLGQMLTQATWLEDSPLLQLSPEINSSHLAAFRYYYGDVVDAMLLRVPQSLLSGGWLIDGSCFLRAQVVNSRLLLRVVNQLEISFEMRCSIFIMSCNMSSREEQVLELRLTLSKVFTRIGLLPMEVTKCGSVDF